jgi:hypothetical protein
MRRLNEILENINSQISASLKYPKVVYYTQAELHQRNEATFPIINNGNGKGTVISPDGNIALQTYYRILSSETETDYTKGKGKYPYQFRIYTIKNVWIGTLKRLPAKSYESNDDVKNDVYAAYPVILQEKEIIRTVAESVNKQEILDTEFAGNTIKNLSLDLVLFSIDFELKQKINCT